MKLEQNEPSFLFSTTEIPDIFFTEYLSMANGDFVKVYLYLVFLSKYGKEIKMADLAKSLGLPFKTIQDACNYWEDLGVIIRKPAGYLISNLQETELHKLYKPKLSLSPEDTEKNSQAQYRAKIIDNINNLYFQGIMSPSWYNDIMLWFKKYNFDEQVMVALFGYCFDKSALHKRYVETVANAWHQSDIRSFTDLDSYFHKQEKLNSVKKAVVKKLRLNRNLTQYEEAYIEKWIVEYGYDFIIIELALKKTTSKASFNFEYLHKLLTSWKERNLKTVSEVEKFMEDSKVQAKAKKELEKKSFNSYGQRNYENLDKLYETMQDKKQG